MLKYWIVGVLYLGVWSPVEAADWTPEQRLRRFLAQSATLQAHFTQAQVDENGRSGKKSQGMFYIQRPGHFRWNYEVPYVQEIVSKGDKVWFYDKELEQVTVKRLNTAIGSTPALLLSGEAALEKSFSIEKQTIDEGLYWIKLVPKSEESSFRYVLLGLEGDILAGMELSDQFGQLTRLYFDQVKTGVTISASIFDFTPPPGVDVFEEK